MPVSDLLPRLDQQLQLRISTHELRELNAVARRLTVPRSIVVRAAIRAVVSDPTLVWAGPLFPEHLDQVDDVDRPALPARVTSQPPNRRRRRGKR